MTIKLKRKHFFTQQWYSIPDNCPMALATREALKLERVKVGASSVHSYEGKGMEVIGDFSPSYTFADYGQDISRIGAIDNPEQLIREFEYTPR